MVQDADWISKRVAELRQNYPTLTNAVMERLETLLRGELTEGSLRPGRLNEIATQLLADLEKEEAAMKLTSLVISDASQPLPMAEVRSED